MKRTCKKTISFVLAFLMVIAIIPNGIVKVHAGLSISQIQAKFPSGKYWNHIGSNNPDGWTNSPCTHHGWGGHSCGHAACIAEPGYCCYYGDCGCNSFDNAIQCMGYAYKVAYDYYGSSPRTWSTSYDAYSLKPGDYVRLYGHSIWITDVVGDTVTYTEANINDTCMIRWGTTKTKQDIANSLDHISVAPYAAVWGSAVPTVSTNRKNYGIGENVTFSFNAPGAISVVLYVYFNGEECYEGMLFQGDTYTRTQCAAGNYRCYIIARYPTINVQSDDYYFDVNSPSTSTNRDKFGIGENVTFSFNAPGANNVVLYVYLNGEECYEGMLFQGDTYTRTQCAAGQYKYYIIAQYATLSIKSEEFYFDVYVPSVLTNRDKVGIGEDVTFSFNAPGANDVVLYVYLDGEEKFEGLLYQGNTYTQPTTDVGHYRYYIVTHYPSGTIIGENYYFDVYPIAGTNCIIDYSEGFIYGLCVGIDSLVGYVNIANGYELSYTLTINGFGTGTIANVKKDGAMVESYMIIIFGDVTSDGNIDSNDAGIITEVENYNVTWEPIADAAYIKAADVNGDGNIDSNDAGIMVEVENYNMTIDQTTGLAVLN